MVLRTCKTMGKKTVPFRISVEFTLILVLAWKKYANAFESVYAQRRITCTLSTVLCYVLPLVRRNFEKPSTPFEINGAGLRISSSSTSTYEAIGGWGEAKPDASRKSGEGAVSRDGQRGGLLESWCTQPISPRSGSLFHYPEDEAACTPASMVRTATFTLALTIA